jgi:hypothetical protein
MRRLEANRKKKTTSQKLSPSATFHKRKVFTMSTGPLIDSQEKNINKVYYIKRSEGYEGILKSKLPL